MTSGSSSHILMFVHLILLEIWENKPDEQLKIAANVECPHCHTVVQRASSIHPPGNDLFYTIL